MHVLVFYTSDSQSFHIMFKSLVKNDLCEMIYQVVIRCNLDYFLSLVFTPYLV